MRFAKEDKKKKIIPSPSSHGDLISTNPDNNNNNQGANGYLLNQFLKSQVNNRNS